MEKSKKSINVEGGILFCGVWNFSKSVSVGPTFIREMRVLLVPGMYEIHMCMKKKTFINFEAAPSPGGATSTDITFVFL